MINNGTAGIQNHGGLEAPGFAAVKKLEKMKITSRLLSALCELCGEQKIPPQFNFPTVPNFLNFPFCECFPFYSFNTKI